ncbi:MAG TPA: class I SAM-dependent methyltransferase, partial [Isosphaeraceae bacterium]|nr:class I SAM-dependent methyltransferase [Isosphaeraceae bacterium]
MNPVEYDRLFQNEDHYWWYKTRRELVVKLVQGLELSPGARILDVGCGTGATAAALGALGRVAAADLSPLALERCRRRGVAELLQARAEALPLRSDSCDVIVAIDIIEHIDDDLGALRELRRVLRPGGCAVITVPAYQMLWSEHDVALMHKRRYVASQLKARMKQAGFETVRLTYAVGLLLPLALARLLKRAPRADREPQALIWQLPRVLNAALVGLQRFENALLGQVNLPFGLSVVAVVRKPARVTAVSGPRFRLQDARAAQAIASSD